MKKTIVRVVFATMLSAIATASAVADDFVWTGKAYIPIPAVFNQDVIVSFPEPVEMSFQQNSAVQTMPWDDHSIQIRPKVKEQEQRVLIRGKKTGKAYYAKLSSSLPFVPFRNVIDGTVSAQEERVAAAGVTQLGLMKAMMTANGIPPSGFEEQPSSTTLLDMAPFKIVASSVWSSPSMVGIIATLSSTIPGATIPIVPTNIQLKVPQFGALRIMGADSWELSPAYPSTQIYLIFAR